MEEGLLEHFYRMRKAGFEPVEEPQVGDTVWYLGKGKKQGIVTEEGVRTRVGKRKKYRFHILFGLEDLGSEAIFFRQNVNKNHTDISEGTDHHDSGGISDGGKNPGD